MSFLQSYNFVFLIQMSKLNQLFCKCVYHTYFTVNLLTDRFMNVCLFANKFKQFIYKQFIAMLLPFGRHESFLCVVRRRCRSSRGGDTVARLAAGPRNRTHSSILCQSVLTADCFLAFGIIPERPFPKRLLPKTAVSRPIIEFGTMEGFFYWSIHSRFGKRPFWERPFWHATFFILLV